MQIFGIVSSDDKVNEVIERAHKDWDNNQFKFVFLKTKKEIFEFINYELPEIVIINFSDPDPAFALDVIINYFEKDVWLHSFGIIGIYKNDKINEEELLKRLKNLNLLALINEYRIKSHLMLSIEIIHKNKQIIFQKGLGSTLMNSSSGSFIIPNDILSVPIYAGLTATSLSQVGKISADRKMHLQLALAELIVNGIEHGNCGITYNEKTDFLEKGLGVAELVAEKCKNPKIAKKRVKLEWETGKFTTKYIITDEGNGFDFDKFNNILKSQDELSLHGRGINLAYHLSKDIYYNEKGNKVTMIIEHDNQTELKLPFFYRKEEILSVKRGDIIFREGEDSDFLYYIASGSYCVFHNNKKVGEINRNDIFMGEMSFLLRNTRSGTIKAAEEGKLVKISRKDFISLVRDYPYYGIFLSSLLAKRLARSNEINTRLSKMIKK